MDITKSREEFEAWIRSLTTYGYGDLDKDGDCYFYQETEYCWQAYKAGRESIEVELPELCGDGENDTDYIEGLNDGIIQSARALHTAGIRIKGESE